MSIGSIDGIISGLSASDIVNKLMAAERLRVTTLEDRKQENETRADALRDIATRLTSLSAAITTLSLRGTMLGRSATVNTPPNTTAPVSVSASAEAALGSFTVRVGRLATASSARGTAAAGTAIDASALLKEANGVVAPTSGDFTINGVRFSVDVATDSLNDVINRINAQSAVTGVTATLVADAAGRAANRLQLTTADPVGQPIQLGSAADTSTFLAAMHVLGAPAAGDGSIVGQDAIGGVKLNALLKEADTATPIAGSGSFTINGVEIGYNADVDTLNDVIGRINASKAGVTAAYDTRADRLVLTNNATGDLDITLAEGASGNFLTTFALVGAGDPVALGQTAQYSLDGGASWRYSVSNTVGDAVPGVTLTLREASAADATVTIGANTDGAVSAIKAFVDAFNNAVDLIESKTAAKNLAGKPEPLAGDFAIRSIAASLRTMATSRALGLTGAVTSLQDVGITTGAVGSAFSANRKLTVDEAKLRAALTSNPSAVFDLFSATSQVALTTPGDVARVSGAPTSKVSGVYSIASDGAGLLSGVFTPSGGSATALTGAGAITTNGANTTLIPGLILTGATAFAGAATTITVNARAGIAAGIGEFVKGLTQSGGTLDSLQETISSQQRELDDRIRTTTERLDARERNLFAQFQRLEVALSKMQSQSAQLMAGLAGFGQPTA